MKIIYKPRGAALEYAPWAANLYSGCSFGCRYCFVPACVRKSRHEFHANPQPRRNVLADLTNDLKGFDSRGGRVLLSFTSDPYQPIEGCEKLTRAALALFHLCKIPVAILTKNPMLMWRDIDLLSQMDVTCGTTIAWDMNASEVARTWEPFAPSPTARLAGLAHLKAKGLKTWVSMEPVIDPKGALRCLLFLCSERIADEIKIGKWNHDAGADKIDWARFLTDCKSILAEYPNQRYMIKDALKKFAGRTA